MKDFNVSGDFGPGTVVIVGPTGRFAFDVKKQAFFIEGCLFLGLEHKTPVFGDQRRFLNRVYEEYFNDAGMMEQPHE